MLDDARAVVEEWVEGRLVARRVWNALIAYQIAFLNWPIACIVPCADTFGELCSADEEMTTAPRILECGGDVVVANKLRGFELVLSRNA